MKKITLLFLLSLFFSNAQEVLNEDFEGGIPLTWSNENLNSLGDPNEIWTIDNTGLAYYVSATAQYMYTAAGMSGNYAIFILIFAKDNEHLRKVLYEQVHLINGVAGTDTFICFDTGFKRNIPIQ